MNSIPITDRKQSFYELQKDLSFSERRFFEVVAQDDEDETKALLEVQKNVPSEEDSSESIMMIRNIEHIVNQQKLQS